MKSAQRLLIQSGVLLFALGIIGQKDPLRFAFAQDPPPGSSAEITEAKVREEAKKELLKKKPSQELQPEAEKPYELKKKAPTFRLRKIHLEGDILLPSGTLEPLFGQYERREVSFEDMKTLNQSIEAIYREKGYFAVVYIPAQKVKAGELTLRVASARMGRLKVEGLRYFRKKKTLSYWSTPPERLLNYEQIRRDIFAMNENPDRFVRPVLLAGAVAGTTDVLLKVADQLPLHAGYTFDNGGTKLTGRERTGFKFRHNNLLTMDDTFLIGTVFGQNFGALYLNHMIPLTKFGTRLVTGFSHAQVNPKKEFKINGISGISETYSLQLFQRLFQRERFRGEVHLGFDFKEKRTRVESATSVWDRLRVLSAGGDFQASGFNGVWKLSQNFFFGFSPHGNGFPLTSRGGRSRFFKYAFSVERLQNLFWGTKASLYWEGQLSPHKLTPQEEVSFGGATSVRGYPESDYLADQGLLTRFEYQIPFFLAPRDWKLPYGKQPLREQIQLVSFLDYGYGRLNDASKDERRSRTLFGIGGGFVFHFRGNLSARFEWGVPLGDEGLTESGRSQFYFRLQADV